MEIITDIMRTMLDDAECDALVAKFDIISVY